MKTSVFSFFLLSLFTMTATAQNAITGIWHCPLDNNQGYESETLLLTDDGYYYGLIAYLNGAEYGIGPDEFFGLYEFDGTTLNFYDIKNDKRFGFSISDLDGEGFVLFNQEANQEYAYYYQGAGELTDNQRYTILSWQNYRQLGGTWTSSGTILKVLPNLGIALIGVPDQPDYFNWGHYSLEGNQLSLKEISASETVFYTGDITRFQPDGFSISSQGETEVFAYQGAVQLNEKELLMVQQYMNMNHRINMSIIDGMDGQRDYIWKWVDEDGNQRY